MMKRFLQLAMTIEARVKSLSEISTLVARLKKRKEENKNTKISMATDIEQLKKLLTEQVTEQWQIAYRNALGGGEKTNALRLEENEYEAYLTYLEGLDYPNNRVSVKIAGHEEKSWHRFDEQTLIAASAFRFLPKDIARRRENRGPYRAQLILNVKKSYLKKLAFALTQIFSDTNRHWLEEAQIIGLKNVGTGDGEAVIFFSQAGLQYADEFKQLLNKYLDDDAFIDYIQMGMHAVAKGIAYAERLDDEGGTHNIPPKNILKNYEQHMVAALTETLLDNKSIEQSLSECLQLQGYNLSEAGLLMPVLSKEWLGGFDARLGSAAINEFVVDPTVFASSYTLSSEALGQYNDIDHFQAYAKFIQVGPQSYQISYAQQEEQHTVEAYFLGYRGNDQTNSSPAYIDIPKHAPTIRFLFLGLITRSSIIVTELNETTLRVYHDGRFNSSCLYDSPLMKVDAIDYVPSYAASRPASVYMHYSGNQWQLVVQKQKWDMGSGKLMLATDAHEPILSRKKRLIEDTLFENPLLQEVVNTTTMQRQKLQQTLKALADDLGIEYSYVKDGSYQDGVMSLDHPMIASWQRLRKEITVGLNIRVVEKVKQREILLKAGKTLAKSDEDILQKINTELEFCQRLKHIVLERSEALDMHWLWHNKKLAEGQNGVVHHATPDRDASTGRKSSIDKKVRMDGVASSLDTPSQAFRMIVDQFPTIDKVAFFRGYNKYWGIDIPGYRYDFSLTAMRDLFLGGKLTQEQMGALARRIELVSERQELSRIFSKMDQVFEEFKKIGSVYEKKMSQTIYLTRIGDKKGRCYPLVRAMAVALVRGHAAIDNLATKLIDAGNAPYASASLRLRMGLSNLHSDPLANQASINATDNPSSFKVYLANKIGQDIKINATDYFTLEQTVGLLEKVNSDCIFALNTDTHSMLVARIFSHETHFSEQGNVSQRVSHFYFYDPNFGVVAYKNKPYFLESMKSHFVKNEFSKIYKAFGQPDFPQFRLEIIDAEKMANVHLPLAGITVLDFIKTASLDSVFARKMAIEEVNEWMLSSPADLNSRNQRLELPFLLTKAHQQASDLNHTFEQLMYRVGMSAEYVPVFGQIKESAPKKYLIPFVHKTRTDQPVRWVETTEKTFFEFQRYLNECLSRLQRAYQFQGSEFRPIAEASDIMIDGMNNGFLVQQIIHWLFQKKSDLANTAYSSSLATAITVHSYLNLLQIGQGAVHDLVQFKNLVMTLARGTQGGAGSTILNFAHAFGNINTGVGALLGGVNVGLDAYEFAYGDSEAERLISGTQLAFDSSLLALNLVQIGAYTLGAVRTSSFLGPLNIPLIGISIGAAKLAEAYAEVIDDMQRIENYFSMLDRAYKNKGYIFDQSKEMLIPLNGAVISTLDIRNRKISFGSQYVYSFTYGSPYVYTPTVNKERSNALEVRSGIGYKEANASLVAGQAKTIILPHTLTSYINCYYQMGMIGRKRKGAGADIIRRLEGPNFKLQRNFFPYQHFVRSISTDYVATVVNIILDDQAYWLQAPILAEALQGYLTYVVEGGEAQYGIGLTEGVTFKLSTQVGVKKSRWLLDARKLKTDKLEILVDRLVIGGVTIHIANSRDVDVAVINHLSEVRQINFTHKSTAVSSIDADAWRKHGENVGTRLHMLAKEQQFAVKYVTIDNYRDHDLRRGRAFYDTKNETIFFSRIANHDITILDQLSAMVEQLNSQALLKIKRRTRPVEGVFRLTISNALLDEVFELPQANKLQELINLLKNNKEMIPASIKSLLEDLQRLRELDKKGVMSGKRYKKVSASPLNNMLNGKEPSYWAKQAGVDLPQLMRQLQAFQVELKRLKTLSVISNEAELIDRVGDSLYFYHKPSKVLWRSSLSGEVQAQFTLPIQSDHQSFWREGNILYLACRVSLSSEGVGEVIYRIYRDEVEWVSLLADKNTIETLARNRFIGAVTAWLPNCTPMTVQLTPSVFFMKAKNAPFVMVGGEDSQAIEQRYWIKTANGNVIRPLIDRTLPFVKKAHIIKETSAIWPVPADLMLASVMKKNDGQEVFYFYSHSQQTLYRQEGDGYGLYRIAAVRIPNIIHCFQNGNHFFVVTTAGIVERLDVFGRYHLEGVGKRWLAHRQHWQSDIAELARARSVNHLAVYGAKNQEGGKPILIWYCQGKWIVVRGDVFQGTHPYFLGVDEGKTVARLLDVNSNKLYVQPLMDGALVAAAFGEDLILDRPELIPAARQLSFDINFKSVVWDETLFQLITADGELLQQDANGVWQLLGVDETWLKQYTHNRSIGLQNLVKKWHLSKTPTIEYKKDGIAYFVGMQSAIAGNAFGTMQRLNNILLIQGTRGDDVGKLPRIVGIDTLVLSGHKGRDIYQLDAGVWQHYSTILINNIDEEEALDKLQITVADSDAILMSKVANDIFIIDPNGATLIVKEIYGERASIYRHLQCTFSDGNDSLEYSIDQLSAMLDAQETDGILIEMSREKINLARQTEILIEKLSAYPEEEIGGERSVIPLAHNKGESLAVAPGAS